MICMMIKKELLGYQKAAVEKLKKYKIGALYMDMGTGKTLTALQLIKDRLDQNKIDHCLWLCPCSIKKETEENIRDCAALPENFLTICGIETLSSSRKKFEKLMKLVHDKKCYLIVDESLLVKNFYAKRSENIIKLSQYTKYKLILNGTPLCKNEADLFSQWYILDWRILGYQSYWSFAANHLEYDEKYTNKIRRVLDVEYLADKISPFTVEVKKEDVLKLPKKINFERGFDLNDEQAEHYYNVRNEFLDIVSLYGDYDDTIIFRTFTALQQVTSGERITSAANEPIKHISYYDDPNDNPRIKTLLNVICEIPDDEKIIIWCRYTHEIATIQTVLQEKYGDTVSLYYGELRPKKRAMQLEAFESKNRFLLANKGCGSFGLNLQYCHYMIFYSNDFRFSTRTQAEDRVYRYGQEKDVYIYDIYASSKIDLRILEAISNKESLLLRFKKILKEKDRQAIEDFL